MCIITENRKIRYIPYFLLFTFFFVYIYPINGQKKYDRSFQLVSKTIAEKTRMGYETVFDFDVQLIRRGWWKYAKQFGNPLDMRAYYRVKIPDEITDGNVDVYLYSQTSSTKEGTLFFLGIEHEQYKQEVLKLLSDFKKTFYLEYCLDEIQLLEKQAVRLCTEYDSFEPGSITKDKTLEMLYANRNTIELLQDNLKALLIEK